MVRVNAALVTAAIAADDFASNSAAVGVAAVGVAVVLVDVQALNNISSKANTPANAARGFIRAMLSGRSDTNTGNRWGVDRQERRATPHQAVLTASPRTRGAVRGDQPKRRT